MAFLASAGLGTCEAGVHRCPVHGQPFDESSKTINHADFLSGAARSKSDVTLFSVTSRFLA
jgi:hypothetical protein